MGNGLCRKSNSIEERLTKPQRIVRQLSNVDYRKLRKLIISQKLAPCYDGFDDSGSCSDELNDLEECPICFIFYPSLNRSRCCTKGICTECFLQMKPASTMRPALCPFCKTVGYAVEYRGARTEEEKKLEQAEKQKVIEAKIRMQSQESHERAIAPHPNVQVPQPMHCSEQLPNGDFHDGRGVEESLLTVATDMDGSPAYSRHPEFNLDLDEIILMEAIWQSMKDIQKNSTPELSEPSVTCTMEPVNCPSNQQPLENPLEECEERDQRTHPTSPEFHNLESGIRCEDLSYTHEGANAINSSHQLSCVVSDAFSLHFSADVNR